MLSLLEKNELQSLNISEIIYSEKPSYLNTWKVML